MGAALIAAASPSSLSLLFALSKSIHVSLAHIDLLLRLGMDFRAIHKICVLKV